MMLPLDSLLLFLAASVVQCFVLENQPSGATTLQLYAWTTGDSIPQNVTSSGIPKERRVFLNQNYVPPVAVTPKRSTRTYPNHASSSSESCLQGGHLFLEMGNSLGRINDRLMREAGDGFREIGVAWEAGDWEAVAYAAWDASQTMKLVAQARNLRMPSNDLQQAYAGVAGELYRLSNSRRPRAIVLQGLFLRLYQASQSTLDDDTGRQLQQASRAARSLAKLYGADSSFLPRRIQLWWHDQKEHRNYNNSDPESILE